MKTTQQLPLNLPHLPSLGKEDFLVSNCNVEAANLIDSWPNWTFFSACIYGPEGCGKSHLVNVFSNKISNLTN